MAFGAARAANWNGPYHAISDQPLFSMEERELEDPFIWRTDDEYEMIVKDMDGRICGQRGGSVHAFSEDGLHWAPQKGVLAYSKEVL